MPEGLLTLEDRQAAVDRLATHFAHGHLTDTELEHRLDLAYAADTRAQLTALESDLPALAPETRLAPPSALGAFIVSICGRTEQRGRWRPARTTTVLTMMGKTVLDFREAVIGTSRIALHLITAMGGVEIIVPAGVRARWAGIAVMGKVKVEESVGVSAPDTPLLWISGFVVMGNVKIIERLLHETRKQARRRYKETRKMHRGHRNPFPPPAQPGA
ncbi:DUF1707 SHOCT-like domain-containing protein [Candidatus Synechococcus spongiarum]|uniref:DUF1707 SHOCT-like domain-containing protein n=1 Tax=Candidatus Synechococcus spongiarum TaxID=431041 RepID=UPI000942D26B|nr:DUF1707 domain-containing protein [Candidatus Synechococcus spongiarum]